MRSHNIPATHGSTTLARLILTTEQRPLLAETSKRLEQVFTTYYGFADHETLRALADAQHMEARP